MDIDPTTFKWIEWIGATLLTCLAAVAYGIRRKIRALFKGSKVHADVQVNKKGRLERMNVSFDRTEETEKSDKS